MIYDFNPLMPRPSTQFLINYAAFSNSPLVAHSGSNPLERLGILMNSTKAGMTL